MLIYSGHDSTLVPLLCALGLYDDTWPPYASFLTLEFVTHKENGLKYVRATYNDQDLPMLQVSIRTSKRISLGLKGLFLYTVGILFHKEWCIRQLLLSSIISYNITSIAYNHYTNIYNLLNINIYSYRGRNFYAHWRSSPHVYESSHSMICSTHSTVLGGLQMESVARR